MSRVQIPSPAPKINRPKRAVFCFLEKPITQTTVFLFSSESFWSIRKMRAHGFAPFGFLPIPTNTSIRPTLHRPFSVGLIAFRHKNLPSGNFIVAQSSPAPKKTVLKGRFFCFLEKPITQTTVFCFYQKVFGRCAKCGLMDLPKNDTVSIRDKFFYPFKSRPLHWSRL